jgi:cephalosporin hydroxylase
MAHEAVCRGARANVHELWATLEAVDDVRPRLIVDIGSGPAVQWAWWSLGAQVIGLQWALENPIPGFSGRLPEAVTVLIGDPRDPSTRLRVADQVAGRPVDVLVLGAVHTEDVARAAFNGYAPLVRPGGLVLVHGIANPLEPGVKAFWRGLDACGRREMVGGSDPIGFGIVEIHGKDRAAHG